MTPERSDIERAAVVEALHAESQYRTWFATILATKTLAQTTREYVMAAAALGAGRWRIMFHHILPAVQPIILAVAAPTVTAAILTEAGLNFFGLGDPNWISWGKMIQNGQTFYNHGWWLAVFPGVAIVLTCVGVALGIEGIERRR